MQLVARATGCFWLPAAAKLAWMTLGAENSWWARRAYSCIICFAGPRGEREGIAQEAFGREAESLSPIKYTFDETPGIIDKNYYICHCNIPKRVL